MYNRYRLLDCRIKHTVTYATYVINSYEIHGRNGDVVF